MSKIATTVHTIIESCAPAHDFPLTDGTTLADLQMDSLDLADLVVSLEAEFDVDISEVDESKFFHAGSTVGEIVTWAEKKFGN